MEGGGSSVTIWQKWQKMMKLEKMLQCPICLRHISRNAPKDFKLPSVSHANTSLFKSSSMTKAFVGGEASAGHDPLGRPSFEHC